MLLKWEHKLARLASLHAILGLQMKRGPLGGEYRAALDIIVSARQAAGMTQRELAHKLRKPPSYVAKIELGERKLDFLELSLIHI